jgi:hypothetical protein
VEKINNYYLCQGEVDELKSKKIWIPIVLVAFIFVSWFSWMTIETNKSKFIEKKVKNAVSSSVEAESPGIPRIKTIENGNKIFYVPDFIDPTQAFSVEENALIQLNQDISVPPLKITMFNIVDMGGDLNIHLRVKYDGALGITKAEDIYSHLNTPHYKNKS